jgi:nitroreductase
MAMARVKGSDVRTADHPIESFILDRWSPRAMSGEPITQAQLLALFEAARWAPSSGNSQPWRLLYAHRDTAQWPLFLDLLEPGNREWCVNAAVLVVFASKSVRIDREGAEKPQRTHAYDTGAAWVTLAYQGWADGLVVHGMEGFDYDKARASLGIPDAFAVNAMCAIGRPGPVEKLPERLRPRDTPSPRKKVEEFAFEGAWR